MPTGTGRQQAFWEGDVYATASTRSVSTYS